MFTAKKAVAMQVGRAEALRLGLEKVCDDYSNRWRWKTHAETAKIVKSELNRITTTHQQESEAFKIAWIQFLTAVLADYLQKQNSHHFLQLLRQFSVENYHELHHECLKSARVIYPTKNLLAYLNTQNPACLWIAQGGIDEFKKRYNFYANHSPQSVSISYDNTRPSV